MKRFSNLLWLSPFISFIAGYALISFFCANKTLITPSLIGQNLDKALINIAKQNLTVRVVSQKDNADLQEGTILSQTPAPGARIKEHQSLYLTISQKPAPTQVPNLHTKTSTQATQLLHAQSLHAKVYKISCDGTADQCIAQWPHKGTPADRTVIVYACDSAGKPVIMPNLKTKPVDEVVSFLALNGINPTILHQTPRESGHQCTLCTVIDQRPLAGAIVFVSGDKAVQVQLQVN
jgi:beta-lactam-binding protein with PASTA domain